MEIPPASFGLITKSEWELRCLKKRNADILDAIVRCARDKESIPAEWIAEISDNVSKFKEPDSVLVRAIEEMRERTEKGKAIGVRKAENLAEIMCGLALAKA